VYHDAENPAISRLNIIAQGAVTLKGSTPLRGGRLRAVLDVPEEARIGATGTLRVELSRTGMGALSDQREIVVHEKPPARSGREQLSLPPFETRRVLPDDELWADLGWPDNVTVVASSVEMENGILVIYYSAAYPTYTGQLAKYEQKNLAIAESFTKRYEVWLATHSLLFHRDQEDARAQHQVAEADDELAEDWERRERCRMATVAALFASREVDLGGGTGGDSHGEDM
jgi:hypothetical protein